jgi:photosystem II stability/assembly factor-like uncharacterized protein
MNPRGPIIAGLFIFAGLHAFGQTWSQVTVPGVSICSAIAISADGTKMFAFGGAFSSPESLYTSTNAGASWVSNNIPFDAYNSQICTTDGTNLAALAGAVWISTNSGVTWSGVGYPGYPEGHLSITPDGKKLILLGGELIVSTDLGATWSNTVPSPPYGSVGPLAASSDGTKMVAAGRGGIYTSTNSGQSWVQNFLGGDSTWNSVTCSADGSKMAAAADPGDGGIFVSTNGGTTWTETDNRSSQAWQIAASVDGTRMMACPYINDSYTPRLYVSSDSGFTWTTAMNGQFGPLACSQDGTRLVAFTNGPATANNAIFIGFWPPSLTTSVTNGNLVISWPAPSAGFVLQQNNDAATTNWTTVPGSPLVTNYQNQVIVALSDGTIFYRLKGVF